MFSEEVKKTTATLFKGDKFIGSGVAFIQDGGLWVLTAAHNIYGKDFDKEFVCGEWSVEDYEGNRHAIAWVNADFAFSKANDIALLKLNCATALNKFNAVHFAPRPENNVPEFFFRGRYGSKSARISKGSVVFQENVGSSPYQFFGTIDKEHLIDRDFSAGSDWLGGCSGSGLFLQGRNDIVCSGILLEIPDKGDNGQLQFCGVSALPALGLDVGLLPVTVYDFNPDAFTAKWFSDKLNASIDALGKRYTPKLNFVLPISKVMDGLSRNQRFKKQIDAPLGNIYKKRRSCHTSFGSKLIEAQQKKIDELLTLLRQNYFDTVFSGFEKIDYDRLIENCNEIIELLGNCIDIFYKAQRELENEKPTPRHSTAPHSYEINELYALKHAVEAFAEFLTSRTCRLTNKPVLILKGEAGYGKSHLLGDFCRKRQDEGFDTILLIGQHFTGVDNPWHQILQRQLVLQKTDDEFLGQLNIKAHLTGKRILLVIDAINEGNGKVIWPGALKNFIEKVSEFDGLGLVVSVRSSYEELLVDETLYTDEKALSLTHHGFSEHEYEAADYFFDNYGIKKPRIPFLHPEFRSPLFLKLFCDGLKAKGLTEIPEGYEGITAILNFFLDAVNSKLAERMAYDPATAVVRAAVEAIAEEIINTGSSYVPYKRAVSLLAGLEESKLTNAPGLVASKLVDEGVFSKNLYRNDKDEYDEGIYFLYERFFDHTVANLLITRLPADPSPEFLPGGSMFEYFKDRQSCYANSGLVEAFSIQIPEKFGHEYFEYVPHVRAEEPITEALIASLIWRKASNLSSAVGSPIREFLKEMMPKHNLTGYFLENILLLSGIPDHPYNALYMHEILMGMTLPVRDSGFTHWLTDNYNSEASGVRRLIDWAWKDQYRREIEDESILLSCIALSWFLISPNRNIRDGATKALICLLQYRAHLIVKLLQKFKGINDPYVYERLFAVAYGCTMRAEKLVFLQPLCNYIFKELFDKELVYPNILVRDYATGIIVFAQHKGIAFEFDITRCKPPFQSEPIPAKLPTNAQIDKAYKLSSSDDGNYHYQNEILDSMTTEYGRGIAKYGDFGRYIFGSALHDWGLNDGPLSNYGVKRIFELGYDIKLHGNYDSNAHSDGQERIGKKYQWIVLHEILARIADHTIMNDESRRKKAALYQGAWQPNVRDIDPSMIIRKTGNQNDWEEGQDCWWVADNELRFDLNNKEWLKLEEDMPDDKSQIVVTDEQGVEWICLYIRISQSEETDITQSEYNQPQKNFYNQISAYIASPDQFEPIQKWIPKRDRRHDDIPEPPHQTQVFSREYYWSPAYVFHQDYYYGGNGDGRIYSRKLNRDIAEVHVPYQYILWEKRRDYSIEETISFFKPTTKIKDGLGLTFMHEEGEMADAKGQLGCLDPSIKAEGPSCLLVRKDLLLDYLTANNLKIFWLTWGEKRILSSRGADEIHNPKINHDFDGFYYMEDEELKGDRKSKITSYK